MSESVEWNGRTYGQLSADEKLKVKREVASKLQDELTRNADAIAAILEDRLEIGTRVRLADCDSVSRDMIGLTGTVHSRTESGRINVTLDEPRYPGVPLATGYFDRELERI